MRKLSLSRKVEKVLTAYLADEIDDEDLNVYEGHVKSAIVEFPHLVCYAQDAQPHPDMPSSTGVRVVAMRFELRADSETEVADHDPRAEIDGWRMTLEDAMSDIGEITAFVGASDIDWEGFYPHIYDVIRENEPTEFENTDWVEQFVLNVVCQLVPVPVAP